MVRRRVSGRIALPGGIRRAPARPGAAALALLSLLAASPAWTEISFYSSDFAVNAFAGADRSGDNVVADEEAEQRNTARSDLLSFSAKEQATTDSNKGSASQTSNVSATATTLRLVSNASCDGAVAFGGRATQAYGDTQLSVSFTVTAPARLSVSGSLSAVGQGGRASLGLSSGGGVEVIDGSEAIAEEVQLEPGTHYVGLGCGGDAYFDPGFGGVKKAKASWSLNLTVTEDAVECDGGLSTWVGGSSGAFGDPASWDPPQVPGFEEGGACDTALFDTPRATVDFAPTAAAASRASGPPRGALRREVGRLQLGRGTLTALQTRLDLKDASNLDPSLILRPGSTLLLGSGADVVAQDVRLDPGSALELLDVFQLGCADMTVNEGRVELRGGLVACSRVDASTGELDFEGRSSTVDVAGHLLASELRVADGAQLESFSGAVYRGPTPSTIAGLADDGTEATWRSGQVSVVNGGLLIVDAGGLVDADTAVVGSAGQGGTLRVSTLGRLDVSSSLFVEDDGYFEAINGEVSIGGSLTIQGGGASLFPPDEASPTLTTGAVQVDDGTLSLHRGVHLETAGNAKLDPPAPLTAAVVSVGSSASRATWTILDTLSLGTGDGFAFLSLSGDSLVEAGSIEIGPLGVVQGVGTLFVRSTPPFTGDGVLYNRGWLPSGVLIDGTLINDGGVVERPSGGEGGLPQLNPLAAQLPRVVRRGLAEPAALGAPLVVTGDATLGGTLVLQFRNGYAPAQGQPLAVLDVGGSVTGAFQTIEVQGLAPGALFDGAPSGGGYTVMATNTPEALPPLTIKAKKKLKETKKGGSKLKIGRAGDRSQALLVHYRMGGDARNGDDYRRLEGTLEIPAGKKSATLRIAPIADGFAEPPETIVLELLPGDGYSLPLAAEVAIELVDAKPKKGGG